MINKSVFLVKTSIVGWIVAPDIYAQVLKLFVAVNVIRFEKEAEVN